MITKMLMRWLFAAVVVLFAQIFSYPLVPIACLFANRDTGRLPPAFWWLETPTATLPGPPSITGIMVERYGWWAASVYWLWRNSVYALADKFRVDPDFHSAKLIYWGDLYCNNDPYKPGVFFGLIRWDGKCAFEFRAVWPMPWNKAGMLRIGWKLSSWFEGERPEKPTATGMFQHISIRPLLSRK